MVLTLAELRLLLEALDMAAGRHQSQADFYDARPERFSTAKVTEHEDKAAAMQAMACRLSTLKPRQDVLSAV
jgi:hypothetical protein